MNIELKPALKQILGELPYIAETYWYFRQAGRPLSADFDLGTLEQLLPEWRFQAETSPYRGREGKKILIFATLRYWIEHATLLAMGLAGLGHRVSLAYLPYARWQIPMTRFDVRRQNLYGQTVLCRAEPLLQIVPFLSGKNAPSLSPDLEQAVIDNAYRDTQYTLQVEDVDRGSELYRLRLERNRQAARSALAWMQANRPDLVIIPNGSILEFGAVHQAGRSLDIPAVTYEFGEQRGRIWLAQNAEVMRQETGDLWASRQDRPLTEEQFEQIRALFSARQKASLWENFARRWQGAPSAGGARVREALGLDDRPVVLLATNVIGDSLTLGRQVFSESMTEWLEITARYFAGRPDIQFVARIHPGELITKGPSVADVVRRSLPEQPENIHIVPADSQINTYDLVEIADLGLVYTTTVGLEMVMSGVPVIAVGNTHYRGKGFTLDSESWEGYFEVLDQALADPAAHRPTREQVDLAWNYAYRFFFEYPHPFPWHIQSTFRDVEEWPLKRVLSEEGQEHFGRTFAYLSGEPVSW
jgi:hypothetical protein